MSIDIGKKFESYCDKCPGDVAAAILVLAETIAESFNQENIEIFTHHIFLALNGALKKGVLSVNVENGQIN